MTKRWLAVLFLLIGFAGSLHAAQISIEFPDSDVSYVVNNIWVLEETQISGQFQLAKLNRTGMAQLLFGKSDFRAEDADYGYHRLPSGRVRIAETKVSKAFVLLDIDESGTRTIYQHVIRPGEKVELTFIPLGNTVSQEDDKASDFTITEDFYPVFGLPEETLYSRSESAAKAEPTAYSGWAYTYPHAPKIIGMVVPILYDFEAYDLFTKEPRANENELPVERLDERLNPRAYPLGTAANAYYRSTNPDRLVQPGPAWNGKLKSGGYAQNGEYAVRLDVYQAALDSQNAPKGFNPTADRSLAFPIRVADQPARVGQYLIELNSKPKLVLKDYTYEIIDQAVDPGTHKPQFVLKITENNPPPGKKANVYLNGIGPNTFKTGATYPTNDADEFTLSGKSTATVFYPGKFRFTELNPTKITAGQRGISTPIIRDQLYALQYQRKKYVVFTVQENLVKQDCAPAPESTVNKAPSPSTPAIAPSNPPKTEGPPALVAPTTIFIPKSVPPAPKPTAKKAAPTNKPRSPSSTVPPAPAAPAPTVPCVPALVEEKPSEPSPVAVQPPTKESPVAPVAPPVGTTGGAVTLPAPLPIQEVKPKRSVITIDLSSLRAKIDQSVRHKAAEQGATVQVTGLTVTIEPSKIKVNGVDAMNPFIKEYGGLPNSITLLTDDSSISALVIPFDFTLTYEAKFKLVPIKNTVFLRATASLKSAVSYPYRKLFLDDFEIIDSNKKRIAQSLPDFLAQEVASSLSGQDTTA